MSKKQKASFPKECEYCQRSYLATRSWQKYCSDNCRLTVFYCRKAGIEPTLHPSTGATPAQEAEWQRRREATLQDRKAVVEKTIEDVEKERQREIAKSKELVKQAKYYIGLDDIGYGKGDEE